jgi:hypothetical protein
MLPEVLQASHAPPQAVLQHTPSTQWPLVHWLEALQELPLDCFARQVPLPQ